MVVRANEKGDSISKQIFIVEIEEAENTRYEFPIGNDPLDSWIAYWLANKLKEYTSGTIPRVTVKSSNEFFRELLVPPTPEKIREIHAAARQLHPDAKSCQCDICQAK